MLPNAIQDIVEELEYKKACGQPNKKLSNLPPVELEISPPTHTCSVTRIIPKKEQLKKVKFEQMADVIRQ